MANAKVIQETFSSGQLSKFIEGRINSVQYKTGLRYCNNFIPLVQGAVKFRGGTKYVSSSKSDNKAWLFPFQYNTEQAYVLEFTNKVMRAYANGAIIGAPYELTIPYREEHIPELQFAQTEDEMVITHKYYAPHRLTRTSATTFSIQRISFTSNQFAEVHAAAVTMTVSATTGSGITITASSTGFGNTGFDNLHVGSLIYIDTDGTGNYGVAQITSRTSSTVVDADVVVDFESTTASSTWDLGNYESAKLKGYPSSICFFEQRAVYGGGVSPQKMVGSKTADFDDTTTGTNDDDAFVYRIASDKVDAIRWIKSDGGKLVIGTFGSEYVASGGGQDDAITPTNVSIRRQTTYGSAAINPVVTDSGIIMVQKDAQSFRSFSFNKLTSGYSGIDLSILSNDITRGGISWVSYQEDKTNIIWCVRNDGKLLSLVHSPEQEVTAWAQHETDGEIVSVASISRTDKSDQTWLSVKRTIDGADKYYIEYFEDQPEIPDRAEYFTGVQATDKENFLIDMSEAQKSVYHVDSGLTYDGSSQIDASLTLSDSSGDITITASSGVFTSGMVGREIWDKRKGRAEITAFNSSTSVDATVLSGTTFEDLTIDSGSYYLTTSSISGLDHLEGESVSIVADGAIHPSKTVSSGAVSLDYQVSVIHAGLPYKGTVISMVLEGGSDGRMGEETSQTKKKVVSRLGFRFSNSYGFECGTVVLDEDSNGYYDLSVPALREPQDWTDTPLPLFSGDLLETISDGASSEKRFIVMQSNPLPCLMNFVVSYLKATGD